MSDTPAAPTGAEQPITEPLVAPAAPAAAPAPVAAAPAAAAAEPTAAAPTAPARKIARKPKAVAVKAEPVVAAEPAAAPRTVATKARTAVIKPRRAVRAAVKAPAPKAAATPKTSPKPIPTPAPTAARVKPALSKPKDKTMAKTPIDFTDAFKTAFADLQDKAKAAYEKSTATFGEANEFAKGNVEALVESGKILASGLQELGTSVATESRTALETLTAEAKELAAVKSPTEFFQLQSSLLRKHFDAMVAQTSKNTEAVMKLANEAFTPLSTRVTLAVEKVSKAA